MWLAISTNGIVHKVVNGYYQCNRAIGKISKSRKTTKPTGISLAVCCTKCFSKKSLKYLRKNST